jgi:Fe-S cluster assembly protein SufD
MNTSVKAKPEGENLNLTLDTYLHQLLQQWETTKPIIDNDFFRQLRQKAIPQALEFSFPTKRDEEWQFTDISELLTHHYQPAIAASVAPHDLIPFTVPEAHQSSLVFVNGAYNSELSDTSALPPGVYVGNLGGLPIAHKDKIVKYLGQQKSSTNVFTSLNTAGLTDVAIIWADAQVKIEKPIQLLFLAVAGANPMIQQPRVLVVAEEGADLSLVEYYGAITNGCPDLPKNCPYFTNTFTEIYLEDNAKLNHNRIQRESGDGFQIANTSVLQGRNSSYTCNEINLGSKLYRHNLSIEQQGEQTETNINGLTMIGGKQISDNHSAIYLNYPHSNVAQIHKCIVDNSAHGIFNGKVFVPKTAQLTNAAQLNRNLLLSPKAKVNTKPELQITADNVKCSHGATVSQLEADELFYLQSRGLTEENARYLLIDAFAADILSRLPLESLRMRLAQCVACRTLD